MLMSFLFKRFLLDFFVFYKLELLSIELLVHQDFFFFGLPLPCLPKHIPSTPQNIFSVSEPSPQSSSHYPWEIWYVII